jgi:hypothetical protein
VVHLSTRNEIIIRNGVHGDIKKRIKVEMPKKEVFTDIKIFLYKLFQGNIKKAAKILKTKPIKWSHFQIVNLEGENDDEIILQADPYPFRWLKAVSLRTGETLWEFNDYQGQKHGGFRAADIDEDGFDEVVGGMVIDQDGSLLNTWNYRNIKGHLDSLTIADVLPNEPGIEWVVTEENRKQGDRTTLLGKDKIFFYHSFEGKEPQNTAVGEFDPERPGLEIWCRSRFDKNQKPWVIDAKGDTITSYQINEKKPDGWSNAGVEVITPIDWTGGRKEYLAVKERHTEGKIGILDPITGDFKKWWDETASRMYIADVSGDAREEIIVINSDKNEIKIYSNNDPAEASQEKRRKWDQNVYRRTKLNYNYYSP